MRNVCVRYTLHKSDAALAAVAKAIGQTYRRPARLVDCFNIRISEVAPSLLNRVGDIVSGCLQSKRGGIHVMAENTMTLPTAGLPEQASHNYH